MEDIKTIKALAEEAAKEAGEYILSRVDTVKEICHKRGKNDLVTDVDKASEKIIIRKILEKFPDHSILAEESGEHEGEETVMWIIDPIDGTTNFAHGFPMFCVSIGVMLEGTVKAGVVYDPTRDELFSAEEGNGAFLNGERLFVSGASNVCEALISTGFAYDVDAKKANLGNFTKMLEVAQAVRRPGSAALDLCAVASGRFDGFWEMGLSPWDMAAGQLIVKEAGGVITDPTGKNFDLFGGDVLASNGKIHKEMVDLLSF